MRFLLSYFEQKINNKRKSKLESINMKLKNVFVFPILMSNLNTSFERQLLENIVSLKIMKYFAIYKQNT